MWLIFEFHISFKQIWHHRGQLMTNFKELLRVSDQRRRATSINLEIHADDADFRIGLKDASIERSESSTVFNKHGLL